MTETPTAARPADPAAPVFVDASGRRQRRSRRIGWLLAVPAAGYLALVASSALGGPTLGAPFLPRPAAPAAPGTPTATAPSASTGPMADGRPTPGPDRTAVAATRPAQAPAAPAAASSAARSTATATAPAPGPTAAPTPGPTASHGRPTTAPSNSRKPTKSP
ncbi:hypothetical protein [Kitasatospora sp. NRRL B-11411]|uniref:hypothetical protein n=1 Tax=Kitasatospora sp. NRRL B-11411 TaxID=1463822 RepID=UPI0004C35046|nr:hypothetical protein [Kitasatospora sp. NRRL B-11411]